MIAHGVGPSDLIVALKVLVGIEDAVPDIERQIVNGKQRGRTAIVRGDELADDALIDMRGDAALSKRSWRL